MRVLVLSDEVWNDRIHGNNVISNWFEGMDAEFANIYASPGMPENRCCDRYFQITDKMMLRSIFSGSKAGKAVSVTEHAGRNAAEGESQRLYRFLKSISGSWLRLIRSFLWILGRYDCEAMRDFLEEFRPDVIFTERMASCKMLRLENVVAGLCDVPMFAFTGDDEYSMRRFTLSPFFWINRLMVRKQLRENVNGYQIYYTLSREQKEEYERIFGCKCKLLRKCGDFSEVSGNRDTHRPIRMVYAGKFYCNRWKMLARIADALREINKEEVRITLDIYTKDIPTARQNELLNNGRSTFIRGPVSQEELRKVYRNADIALHVESYDLKNRLATRLSFSTKIVDCLFSGCAVLAYCWDRHSGYTYLREEDAAICVSSEAEMKAALKRLCADPQIVADYAAKALDCARRNHLRAQVQEMLLQDFRSGIQTAEK